MNIIDKIENELNTDDANRDKQGKILLDKYHRATLEQQIVIDDIFISLCGWSLETLILAVLMQEENEV